MLLIRKCIASIAPTLVGSIRNLAAILLVDGEERQGKGGGGVKKTGSPSRAYFRGNFHFECVGFPFGNACTFLFSWAAGVSVHA